MFWGILKSPQSGSSSGSLELLAVDAGNSKPIVTELFGSVAFGVWASGCLNVETLPQRNAAQSSKYKIKAHTFDWQVLDLARSCNKWQKDED